MLGVTRPIGELLLREPFEDYMEREEVEIPELMNLGKRDS